VITAPPPAHKANKVVSNAMILLIKDAKFNMI